MAAPLGQAQNCFHAGQPPSAAGDNTREGTDGIHNIRANENPTKSIPEVDKGGANNQSNGGSFLSPGRVSAWLGG